MRKPFRWVIFGLCGVLLGLVCYGLMYGRGGNLPYARVRVLSLFLHRGMSTPGVQRLLGPTLVLNEPPPAIFFPKTADGSLAFPAVIASRGVERLHYYFDHHQLSMDFISTNAYVSGVLANWAWSDR